MTWPATEFLIGLVMLVVGGRFLVAASVDTARRLRVSPLVVGLTLVAWGTSAPELALNIISAYKGLSGLAVGNVVGANICNMALVLGVASQLKPLVVETRVIKVEVWLNAAILGFMAAIGLTTGFGPWTSSIMLFIFGLYSMWTIMAAIRDSARLRTAPNPVTAPVDPAHPTAPMGWVMIATNFIGGLLLLSYGGSFASDGASQIAIALGVPPSVVGVTIVAIGTTLPELITGVLAVRRGQTDLAMGNALGSCLFNAGAIFGVVGVLAPPAVGGAMTLPLAYMGLLALALVPISRTYGQTVSRLEGIALLASYVAFLALSAWLALR